LTNIPKWKARKEHKAKRHKQKRINVKLKKKLFGHLFMAPCYYCKRVFMVTELTVEHIVPLCLGGSNDPANIALACAPCNHERGRDAWMNKKSAYKKYNEQHYSQHRSKNRQSSV
jgi:5-methylcytosine-specific restriction endonuclease McrA